MCGCETSFEKLTWVYAFLFSPASSNSCYPAFMSSCFSSQAPFTITMPQSVQAPTPSSRRNEGFAVSIDAVSAGHTNGSYAKCSQTSRKVSDMMRQVIARSQDPTCEGTPRSHQPRWSADLCKGQTPCVIIVRKNKKEPEPPQRSLSLLRPYTASRSPLKRYSCPPIGVLHSPSRESSSSSSATSSCSSPRPVPTSVITGHDPLGWKLHPRSSSTSSRARANRLSLQIPFPVVSPDPKSSTTGSQSHNAPNADPAPKTKPPLRLKPTRRCHSDSSAFPRPLEASAAPVVRLEDLCAVHLRPVTHPDQRDHVFSDGDKGHGKPSRIPPPVPNKTLTARQIAQLIAHSRRRCKPAAVKAEGDVCATATDPRQTADYNNVHATQRGRSYKIY